jgi:putative transposase
MRLRFTKAQILAFLREAEAGTPVMDLCWNHCFSRSTFRAWKAKYGDLIHAGTGRVEQLEGENARLREALARATAAFAWLPRQSADAALFPAEQKASRRVARSIRSAVCAAPISSPRR